ncbi:MAG TPA: hypothetical protein VGB88_06120 [Alphaproteobacteria bacterium]
MGKQLEPLASVLDDMAEALREMSEMIYDNFSEATNARGVLRALILDGDPEEAGAELVRWAERRAGQPSNLDRAKDLADRIERLKGRINALAVD